MIPPPPPLLTSPPPLRALPFDLIPPAACSQSDTWGVLPSGVNTRAEGSFLSKQKEADHNLKQRQGRLGPPPKTLAALVMTPTPFFGSLALAFRGFCRQDEAQAAPKRTWAYYGGSSYRSRSYREEKVSHNESAADKSRIQRGEKKEFDRCDADRKEERKVFVHSTSTPFCVGELPPYAACDAIETVSAKYAPVTQTE